MPLSNPPNRASTNPPDCSPVLELPYGLWRGDVRLAGLQLRPIAGTDELAVAEALADGASAAAAGNLLIGRCAGNPDSGLALGPEAAALSVGDREVVLRALHVISFGALVAAQAQCGACRTIIEYDLDLAQPPDLPPEPGPWHQIPAPAPGDAPVACRLLTGADLEIAAACDPRSAGPALVRAAIGNAALPPDMVAAALDRLDPNAETGIDLACPVCGAESRIWVDSFALIRRALAAAGGIFAQIHRLASAYGWAEADILALPRRRRLHYCDLLAAAVRP
jgi:hypothetical protein